MIKYWCTYNKNTGNSTKAGYRSLEGFITDIVLEMQRATPDVVSFTLQEEHSNDTFTISNPNYKD